MKPPALPQSAAPAFPDEPPTCDMCPSCHGGGRVTVWAYVREWCSLCGGTGMVPATVAAAWREIERWFG